MSTEFDDALHYALFKGPGALRSGNSFEVRWSSITLAALRSCGVFSNLVDGIVPPSPGLLWLDKNFDPPLLKEWDSVGLTWEVMTFDRLFARSTIIPLTITGGTPNALVVSQPAVFQEGKLYSVMPSASNTDAVTIQVTGVGLYGVKYPNGSNIADTEFFAGRPAIMIFQNGRFELLIGSAGQVASEVAQEAAAAAAGSASSAAGSASAASTSAGNAASSASAASTSAGNASTSATNASNSAGAAAGSASAAAGSASAASTSASNAAGSATSADASKTAAQNAQAAAEAAAGSVQPVNTQIHAATAKTSLADADEFGIADSAASWVLKRVTLSSLISSIFKTTRTLANAQFASATFKLFNASGTPRALMFNTAGLTADRTITMPDSNVDLSNVASSDVKAWVNFNGTGTVAIRSSKNVSSITDNGNGDYTVNFSSALTDANYAVAATGTSDQGNTAAFRSASINPNTAPTASAVRIVTQSSGGNTDMTYVNVIITR